MAKRNKKKWNINPIGLLLLSLLLHILFFIFTTHKSLWDRFSPTFPSLPKESQLSAQEKDLPPAKLSPRKSSFGVMFITEESPPSPQQQTPQTQLVQTQPQQQPPQPAKAEEAVKRIVKREQQETPPPPPATVIEAPSPITAQLSQKQQPAIATNQQEEVYEEIQTIIEKQEIISKNSLSSRINQAFQQPSQAEQVAKEAPEMHYAYKQPPKKKTLLAMTKGFIENLKDKGTDWLEQEGVKRDLTQEELKYISYEEQVNWALQASWKRYFAHQIAATGNVAVTFLLDANGNVIETKLIRSSGNETLDDMVLKSINKASPFPPLPKFFEKQEYQVARNIHVA